MAGESACQGGLQIKDGSPRNYFSKKNGAIPLKLKIYRSRPISSLVSDFFGTTQGGISTHPNSESKIRFLDRQNQKFPHCLAGQVLYALNAQLSAQADLRLEACPEPLGVDNWRASGAVQMIPGGKFMKSLVPQIDFRHKFADVIPMANPQAVLEEVCRIVLALQSHFDFPTLFRVFDDMVRLFGGEYPGYRKCNTWYHDLEHTTDCLLAMARLMHGASVHGWTFSDRDALLGLTSALLHDTGYIQRSDDFEGTGAKYTLVHIDRSIAFMDQYMPAAGFAAQDLDYCLCCVRCTGLDVKIGEIQFESPHHHALGRMLGTADLLGQMASRTYLERLPFLYREFREGKVPGFDSELDLLRKTPAFWEFTQQRFASDLGNVAQYMRDHFREWWGLDRDLNRETIEEHIGYLKFILENHESDYRAHLRRDGLMQILDA
jgi:hypothetical protein